MTTYYKGNNIGLNYDAAAGSWSFTNTPQDFIDPNAFSTLDPVFPTTPTTPTTSTTSTTPEPESDPCPAGYVYDESLKQCVPDPNYQNPFVQQDDSKGRTQADSPKPVFIDFDSKSEIGRKDMYNHALTKNYIDKDGNLLGPPKAPILPFGMTAIAQFGINRQYNRWLKEMGRYDADMKGLGKPSGFAQAIGFAKILPRFYETSSKTQIRGRDTDVSDDAKIKTTDTKTSSDLDSQITETKAGETQDIVSDIAKRKSGTSYTDSSGDTYTSTGDGGVRFEPKDAKPIVQKTYKPTKNYQGSTTYGTRGASASAQKQMKQMDTRKTQSGPDLRNR